MPTQVWPALVRPPQTIAGTAEAELIVSLRDEWGAEKARVSRKLSLPVHGAGWRQHAQSIRSEKKFKDAYDEAESCLLTVHRDGVGIRRAFGCRPGGIAFQSQRESA